MADKLSERELESLFKKYMPSDEIPSDLADRVQQRVLAEVSVTLRQNAQSTSPARGWWSRLWDAIPRLQMGPSLALAGATIAVLVLLLQFGDEFAAQITGLVQEPSTARQPGSIAVSTTDPTPDEGSVSTPTSATETPIQQSGVLSPTETSTSTATPEDVGNGPSEGDDPSQSGTGPIDDINEGQQPTQNSGGPTPTDAETPGTKTVQAVLTTQAQKTAEAEQNQALESGEPLPQPTSSATTDAATGKPDPTGTLNPTPTFQGGAGITATPTPTSRETASPTSPAATTTAGATSALTPTATPRVTSTPSRAPTQGTVAAVTEPNATNTPTPTRGQTGGATVTSAPTRTPSNTATPSPTDTVTPVPLQTPKPSITSTASPSPTATDTPSPDVIRPTATKTPLPTHTPTATPTATATATHTPTLSPTPSPTPLSIPVMAPDSLRTDEDVSVTIDLLQNDQYTDRSALTVDILSGPQLGTLMPTGQVGVYTYTPPENVHGTDIAFYQLSENGLLGVGDGKITIQINPVNDPPVITSTPVNQATEGVPYAYKIVATDADEDSLTYSGTYPDWLTLSGDGTLAGTPGFDAAGTYNVSITVSDGQGGSVPHSFTIQVANTNRLPVITSTPPDQAEAGTPYQYVVTATDPDGDALTFSLSNKPDWLELNDNGNGTATLDGTPGNGNGGPNNVTLVVSDGIGQSEAQSFTIQVAVNQPPVITSTPTGQAEAGSLYQYVATATDPDGDALTFSLSNKPEWLELNNNGNGTATLAGTPGNGDGGSYTLTLTVSDGKVTSEAQIFTIQVNVPPNITSTPVTSASEGVLYQYSVTAADANGDALTFSLSEKPDWLELNDNGNGTATLSGTPGSANVGPNNVTLTVSDGKATSAPQQFTIQVNAAPVAQGESYTANYGQALVVDVAKGVLANDTDADGDTLSASVQDDVSSGSLDLKSDGSFTYQPNAGYSGVDEFTYRVEDGNGGVATANATITVTAPPSSPMPSPETEGG